MKKKLSDRVRPDAEAAPWVIQEILLLEAELEAAYSELNKQHQATRAIFDREVWWRGRGRLTARD